MTEFSELQKQFMDSLFAKLSKEFATKTAQIKKEILEKIDEVKIETNSIIQEQQQKIDNLEEENSKIKRNIVQLERKVRKNNLVIFGLNADGKKLWQDVINILSDTLDVAVQDTDINDIYKIGNNGQVKVIEFTTFNKKLQVLKNAKKLKGSNIVIANDLCWEDREKQKTLIKHMKEARKKGKKAHIRGNKLVIDEDVYTADNLESINVGKVRDDNEQLASDHQTWQICQGVESELEQESKKDKSAALAVSTKSKEIGTTKKPQTRAHANAGKSGHKNN